MSTDSSIDPTPNRSIMSSSPAPFRRPPIPGTLRPSGTPRAPRLGLSIPPSPNQKAIQGNSTVPDLPPLQRPSPRPAAPQLRLATPQGSSATPHDASSNSGRPALSLVGIGTGATSASDNSAHSRSDSFGMLDGRVSGPSSASSAERSAGAFGVLGGAHRLRQPGVVTPDPGSAISSIYADSEGGQGMERAGSGKGGYTLPDLDRLTLELGRQLDVDDLDDDGWLAASKAGKIVELGTLGEGAGGAVTRCRLKGGKTVFALKVCRVFSLDVDSLLIPKPDHHHGPRSRCSKADPARAGLQSENHRRTHLQVLRRLWRLLDRHHLHCDGILRGRQSR